MIFLVLKFKFKLSFLNIGGIPLKFINADYPVDYNKNQGYQEIINIDNKKQGNTNLVINNQVSKSSIDSEFLYNILFELKQNKLFIYIFCY